jgi:hypothetical protein
MVSGWCRAARLGLFSIARRVWTDERGFVISLESVLVAAVLVFGLVGGMVELRDAMLAEFNDLANAIRAIDNSYSFSGVTSKGGSWVAGSSFKDPMSGISQQPAPSVNLPAIQIAPAATAVQSALNGSVPTGT